MSENEQKKRGQIQVIFGPMFSGKSTELIRRVRRMMVARYRCMLVKYARDMRYDAVDQVSTHDCIQLAARPILELRQIWDDARQFDVIGIDEGQFFTDVVKFCQEMAEAGKTVIVAALDATYQRKPFGSILELVPLAENVVKLSAVCNYCSEEASFTKRTVQCNDIELIGGTESYVAACRLCFDKPVSFELEAKKQRLSGVCSEESVEKSVLPLSERQVFSDRTCGH